jgi:hypothetical protein
MIRSATHPLRLALLALPLAVTPVFAQEQARTKEAPRISDNSFLVEEAYNQEAGVVQHISNFRRARDGTWLFTFTQEWPAPSQKHQLSYTLPVLSAGRGTGVGDVLLNYRYQLLGHDESRVWFSPRMSVLLATGNPSADRGLGGPGVQVNLPLSVEVTSRLVTHWNAGATATRARDVQGTRRTLRGLNAAASAIWLVAPTLNLMLESTWERAESFDPAEHTSTNEIFTLMPGIRGAINFPSGMQIVPGIGVPFATSGGQTERALFLYFSVEHSFR